MILTTDILRTWFRQFNTDYFDGELPMPRIVLSKARTRLGTMACKCTRRLLKRVYSDFVIRISTYYECTEREFQETLLHEMIHYYIIYKRIPDTSSHGKVFREIMHRLNSKYGWHITITSSMRGRKVADESGRSRRSAFLVLAVVLNDGTCMLSVVSPKSARKLDVMAKGVKRLRIIAGICRLILILPTILWLEVCVLDVLTKSCTTKKRLQCSRWYCHNIVWL